MKVAANAPLTVIPDLIGDPGLAPKILFNELLENNNAITKDGLSKAR